jgi:hypothetical protein
MRVSPHPAQALENAPCGTRHAPQGARLYVTTSEPSTEPSEAAPARALHSADISALLPQVGLPDASRRPTPEGSLPAFAVGDVALRLNPYPAHYRPAFACSLIPYPPSHQLPLRVAFPCEEKTGLPRSVAVTVWVRSRFFAGGASTAPEEFGASGPDHVPFGPSVSASCAWPL